MNKKEKKRLFDLGLVDSSGRCVACVCGYKHYGCNLDVQKARQDERRKVGTELSFALFDVTKLCNTPPQSVIGALASEIGDIIQSRVEGLELNIIGMKGYKSKVGDVTK